MSFAYKFVNDDGKEIKVNITDEVLRQGRREGLTVDQTIERYLEDEGYKSNAIVDRLTAKAKASGGMRAEGGKRKAPTRKPDMDKRSIVQEIADGLKGLSIASDDEGNGMRAVENIEITNIERMIAFTLGDDKYEITLTKKRKPKNE